MREKGSLELEGNEESDVQGPLNSPTSPKIPSYLRVSSDSSKTNPLNTNSHLSLLMLTIYSNFTECRVHLSYSWPETFHKECSSKVTKICRPHDVGTPREDCFKSIARNCLTGRADLFWSIAINMCSFKPSILSG